MKDITVNGNSGLVRLGLSRQRETFRVFPVGPKKNSHELGVVKVNAAKSDEAAGKVVYVTVTLYGQNFPCGTGVFFLNREDRPQTGCSCEWLKTGNHLKLLLGSIPVDVMLGEIVWDTELEPACIDMQVQAGSAPKED